MSLIKNFQSLAKTREREVVLSLVEAALDAIQPENVLKKNFDLDRDQLTIQSEDFNLKELKRIFLIGFGKGSARFSKILENLLGQRLNGGNVIDVVGADFKKITFCQGVHPLPSKENIDFTRAVLADLKNKNLCEKDLVFVVVAGGGSVLFEAPARINLDKLIQVNQALLLSGADIYEINTIRKHLSLVKAGGLARALYPAKVIVLIISDVPGNDLSFVASGPTVKDETRLDQAWSLIKKYNLDQKVDLSFDDLIETPKEENYFKNVSNILILSNLTGLKAMRAKAETLGYGVEIISDRLRGDVGAVAKMFLEKQGSGKIFLAGGETTVKVKTNGRGGRNQALALSFLEKLKDNSVFCSFDSDGWDNTETAGALVDRLTLVRAAELNLNPEKFLEENNSFDFFQRTGDFIETGRLGSNVSDLAVMLKLD